MYIFPNALVILGLSLTIAYNKYKFCRLRLVKMLALKVR
jgi:hypothetical protein